MKKIISLLVACLFLNSAFSQTVEITEMILKNSSGGPDVPYADSEIDIGESAKIVRIFFDFDGIDTDEYHSIYFNLKIDDGSGNQTIKAITYQEADGIALFDILNRTISLGTSTITIEVNGLDDDNTLQTIIESDPWTITYSLTQILGNKICCNQNTFVFPLDPNQINQDASISVSTQDGAAITSIQWQKFANNTWSNISGATQMSYDPPSTSVNIKFRRVLQSASGTTNISNEISITKITEAITGNSICCSQTTAVMPFDPSFLNQSTNTILTSNRAGTTFTYQWQDSTNGAWNNIFGATNSTFDPPIIKNPTAFRRVVISSNGGQSISNKATAFIQPCDRPTHQQNTICGNMAFYKVQNGDLISPGVILGAFISPNIIKREFGYDYMISTDEGQTWHNAKSKQLMSTAKNSKYNNCGTYFPTWDGVATIDATYAEEICATSQGLLDYHMPTFTFDISRGPIQHIYIKRDYYHWYDPFNCGLFGLPGTCKSSWYFQSSSNIVKITLTTGDFPKPVPPITSSRSTVTCNPGDQTITFSVPQLNNGEYYKWTIPSTWTLHNPSAEGYYVNQISVSTNSAGKNAAIGGDVCLTVTQGAETNTQCKTITGVPPFYSYVPAAPTTACEGETVILKPVIAPSTGTSTNLNDYTFDWAAYQSPIQSCNNPTGNSVINCQELKIKVANVLQNPKQDITLTTTNSAGCIYSYKFSLTTAPGLQMGILNSYSDPKAKSNSGLTVNTVNNYLYFTGENKTIYRSYYDNTLGQQIWKYEALKDKNTNQAIQSDGPVAYYKGTTDKLFYVFNTNLYYAESTDNGVTWINKMLSGTIASNIDPRIKIYGNNIYYIETISRKVFCKNFTTNSSSVLIGTDQVNYSQSSFTVESGILAYADISNNIVAFDAQSGVRFNINVSTPIKQLNYNSSISIYNNNIYYISSAGTLRILKRNTSVIYDNFEDVPNLQLAGPFAINKQTGTIYAKAYDVLGKQIYYLNNTWNAMPINNPLSYSAIQSDMTYTNAHAYYIGDNGYLSNTYYIAPCIPAVLRTSNPFDEAGDIVNDPLSNEFITDRSVLLYPNPTAGLVKATFTIPETSSVRINIIPITGGASDVLANKIMESGTQELNIDLSNYSSGVYLIQLFVNESLYTTSKVIKF